MLHVVQNVLKINLLIPDDEKLSIWGWRLRVKVKDKDIHHTELS